jgi:hypothetical protein
VQPRLLTRVRWRLEDLWDEREPRVLVAPLAIAALVFAGFLAGREIGRSSPALVARPAARVLTLREPARAPVESRPVTRWRTHDLYAGIEPRSNSTRYQAVYRKHLVTVRGKTRTVLETLPSTEPVASTKTQTVTVTGQATSTEVTTVTQPVTRVVTATAVTTVTQPLPVTITVTLPRIP